MSEYVAVRDTVYNFKFIKKGQKVVSNKLDKSPNFTKVEETSVKSNQVNNSNPVNDPSKIGEPEKANSSEQEIRLRAKELKIQNWHLKGIANLLSEIAEVEAKNAAPSNPIVENQNNGDEQNDDGNNPDGQQGN